MKTKKKARLFIEKLGEKVLSEKPVDICSTKSHFVKLLKELPDGKVKTELFSDVDGYYEEWCGKKVNKKIVSARTRETSAQIYSLYLSEKLSESLDENKLQRLLLHCQPIDMEMNSIPGWLEQAKKLCVIYSGRNEPCALQTIMNFFSGHITDEDTSTCSDTARLEVLKEAVISFLTYCHIKPESAKEFSEPKYEDLVAAILSVYVDMVLVTSRQAAEESKRRLAKCLCSTVLHFIEPHKHLGLDIIIQLDNVEATDGMVIGPLCRKLLEKPTGVLEPKIYTKYIVAGRIISQWLPDVTADLVVALNEIRAPKHYVDWLREQNEEIVDKLPVVSKFKRAKITRFLLNDADQNLINDLLDILTEPSREQPVSEDVEDAAELNTDVSADGISYCFIDRSGNIRLDADAAEPMETEEHEDRGMKVNETEDLTLADEEAENDKFGIARTLREMKMYSKLKVPPASVPMSVPVSRQDDDGSSAEEVNMKEATGKRIEKKKQKKREEVEGSVGSIPQIPSNNSTNVFSPKEDEETKGISKKVKHHKRQESVDNQLVGNRDVNAFEAKDESQVRPGRRVKSAGTCSQEDPDRQCGEEITLADKIEKMKKMVSKRLESNMEGGIDGCQVTEVEHSNGSEISAKAFTEDVEQSAGLKIGRCVTNEKCNESGADTEKNSAKEKKRKRNSGLIENAATATSGKASSESVRGDNFDLLAGLGEICRKGARDVRTENMQNTEVSAVDKKQKANENSVYQSDGLKKLKYKMEKDSDADILTLSQLESGSFKSIAALKSSGQSVLDDLLDQGSILTLSSVSPSKKVSRFENPQKQELSRVTSPADSPRKKLSTKSSEQETACHTGTPSKFDLFASLQNECEDTCDSNILVEKTKQLHGPNVIAETDFEGEEVAANRDAVSVSPKKAKHKAAQLGSPSGKQSSSPKTIPESPTRANDKRNALSQDPALESIERTKTKGDVQINSFSVQRVSVASLGLVDPLVSCTALADSPSKPVRNSVAPEIVEADSSLTVETAEWSPRIQRRRPRAGRDAAETVESVHSTAAAQTESTASRRTSQSPVFTRIKSPDQRQVSPNYSLRRRESDGVQPSLSPSAFHTKGSGDVALKPLTSLESVVTAVDSKQRRSSDALTLSSESHASTINRKTESTEKDAASNDAGFRSQSASPEIPLVAKTVKNKTRENTKSQSRQRTKTADEAASLAPDLSKFLKTPVDKFGFQSDADEVPPTLNDYRVRTRSLSTSSATDGPPDQRVSSDSGAVRLRQTDIRKAFAPDVAQPSSQQASGGTSTAKAKVISKRQPLRVNFDSLCRGRTRTRKASSGGRGLPSDEKADEDTPQMVAPAEHVPATGAANQVAYDLRKTPSSPVASPSRAGGDGVPSASKAPLAEPAISSPGRLNQSRSAATTDDPASSAKCRLFTGLSPKKTVAPVDVLPKSAPLDDDRPSSCSRSASGRDRGSSRNKRAPKSPAPCDTTVRRSARLNTKVSADDGPSSSQTGVTSSQSNTTPAKKRSASKSSHVLDSPSSKAPLQDEAAPEKRARMGD